MKKAKTDFKNIKFDISKMQQAFQKIKSSKLASAIKKNPKKVIIASVSCVLAVAVLGTSIYFGVRSANLKKYKENPARLLPRFTVTAHTGCMDTKDNSIEAMQAGVDSGADVIEFDVTFTEDGTPVLSHDKPKGDEVTLEEAFKFLDENKNIKANLDMKSVSNMEAVRQLVIRYRLKERVFFTGITMEDVGAVKSGCPIVPYYLNVDVDEKKNTDDAYIKSLAETVENMGAIGINFNYKSLSSDIVRTFRVRGLLVSVWTVDSEYDMYKVLTMSIDNITTRNPDKLTEILG